MLSNLYSLSTSTNVPKETILNDFGLVTIFNLITEIQNVETDSLENNTPIEIFLKAISDAEQKISWWQSLKQNITAESKTKLDSDVTNKEPAEILKYSQPNNIQIDPDIKSKLTNLNIPLQSFSYALTLVKTTYVKETGRQLRLYDTDKEALFKELSKKK
jgi:hypothetical protein